MQLHHMPISKTELYTEEDSGNTVVRVIVQYKPALLISDIRRQSVWVERNIEKPLGALW